MDIYLPIETTKIATSKTFIVDTGFNLVNVKQQVTFRCILLFNQL